MFRIVIQDLSQRKGAVTKDNIMLVVKNAVQGACTEANIRRAAEHVGFKYTGGGEVLVIDSEAIQGAVLKHSDKYVISRCGVDTEHAKLRSRAVLEARSKRLKISEFAAKIGMEIPAEIKIRQLMLLNDHNTVPSAADNKSALRLGKIAVRKDKYGARGLNHTDEQAALRELRRERAAKISKFVRGKVIKNLRTGQVDPLVAAKAILRSYPKQYDVLLVTELKALLSDLGIQDIKGKKDQLVRRLKAHSC